MPASAAARVDAILRHQVFLQRLSTGEVAKFVPFLKEMDRELRRRLSGGELTDFNRRRVENLLKAVEELLDAILARYSAAMLVDLTEIAANEASFSTRALSKIVDTTSGVPAAPLIRQAVLTNPLSGPGGGKLLEPFIEDWTASERNAVIGVLRRGIFEGKTNVDIMRDIRGTRALNYADGLLDITARHAEAVVRTAVQHVSSMARQAVFDENADLLKGVQWVSTLDARTCPTCQALDGRVYDLGEGPRPGIHINCRCTIVPVLKGEESAFGRGMQRASKGDEGGRQVSAGTTYYEWLKDQPDDFQDEALGPSRAQLFRDGGIGVKRFAQMQMDRNFAPLTLAEMKRLEPLAFKRAGVRQ